MTNGSRRSEENPEQKLREIPKWTERYAWNRSPVLVLLAVFYGVLGADMGLTLYAQHSGTVPLIYASIVLNVLIAAGAGYLAFSGRLAQWCRRVRDYAVPASPKPMQAGWDRGLGRGLLLPLVPLVALLVIARACGVPTRYWQPVSVIYVVPALVYLVGREGWATWPYLLWPALYLQHAILILAGVRLYLDVWYMDIFLPLGIYGIAGTVVAHIYSRFALRRLRAIARSPEAAEESK
jgi:hypothetical protein